MLPNAIIINMKDNVAVVLQDIPAGEIVSGVPGMGLKTNEDIMKNHKVAIAEIPEGAPVIKYGESIGLASKTIRPGDWVHAHNLK